MAGEIWTYVSTKPSDDLKKVRPVLIIGNDSENNLKFVDIHYVIISSSSDCGKYDVQLDKETAMMIGLERSSVIKTTKIYTGPRSKLGCKIGDLPEEIKVQFINNYKEYQANLIENLNNSSKC